MSTYVKEKVLRIPLDKINLSYIKNKVAEKYPEEDITDDFGWYLESVFSDIFDYAKVGKFQTSPTEKAFFDYVLEYEYDSDSADFGKIRELYDSEKEKYLKTFQQIDPTLCNINDVRLVEFSWYNGTEAPDYYDLSDDPFYEEI